MVLVVRLEAVVALVVEGVALVRLEAAVASVVVEGVVCHQRTSCLP